MCLWPRGCRKAAEAPEIKSLVKAGEERGNGTDPIDPFCWESKMSPNPFGTLLLCH